MVLDRLAKFGLSLLLLTLMSTGAQAQGYLVGPPVVRSLPNSPFQPVVYGNSSYGGAVLSFGSYWDGEVDGEGFLVWNDSKFNPGDGYPLNAVPEPAVGGGIAGLCCLLAARRRRR